VSLTVAKVLFTLAVLGVFGGMAAFALANATNQWSRPSVRFAVGVVVTAGWWFFVVLDYGMHYHQWYVLAPVAALVSTGLIKAGLTWRRLRAASSWRRHD
jgi:hypothetical protein